MSEMKFSKDHEWIRIDGDGATVGITDHAQSALGDIVFVELPEVGREVTAGEACAVVESVKAASDIYAPLTGTIIEVNTALSETPALVNASPTDEGWFFRIDPSVPAEADELMDEEAYTEFLESL